MHFILASTLARSLPAHGECLMAMTRARQTVIAVALSGVAVFAGAASGSIMKASAQEAASAKPFKNTKWDMTVTWANAAAINGSLDLKESGGAVFTYEEGKKHIDGTWSGSPTGDLKMSLSGGSLDYTGKRAGDKLEGNTLNLWTKLKGAFTATLKPAK
jgi:hypothetical protein